jgi:hypothetical protein
LLTDDFANGMRYEFFLRRLRTVVERWDRGQGRFEAYFSNPSAQPNGKQRQRKRLRFLLEVR